MSTQVTNIANSDGLDVYAFERLLDFNDNAVVYVVLNDKDYHISVGQLKALIIENLPPSPLPEGLVNTSLLEEALAPYAKTEVVEELVRTSIAAIPSYELPEDVIKEASFDDQLQKSQSFIDLNEVVRQLSEKEVFTKEEIGQLFVEFKKGFPVDLVDGQRLQEALDSIPSLPSDLVNETQLEETVREATKDIVTQEQLEGKITDVLTRIDNLPKPDPIPEDLVNEQRLQEAINSLPQPDPLPEDLVNEQRLREAIESIPGLPEGLVNEQRLQEALSSLPVEPDLSIYSTKEELTRGLDAKLSIPAQVVEGAILTIKDNQLVAKAVENGRVFYVNPSSQSDIEDGSVFNPYKTIQAALNVAPAVSVIQLSPGSHRGDIQQVKENVLIQGYGCIDSNPCEIVGTVTLSGLGSTRFRLKDVQLKNSDVNKPALLIKDSPTKHYFNNVSIEPIAGSLVPCVQFEGSNSNWTVFAMCNIGGEVLLGGTPVQNTAVYFQGAGHAKTHVNIQADYNVALQNIYQLDGVTHAAGKVGFSHVTRFGSKGFTSTVENAVLMFEYTTFRTLAGTFAPYSVKPSAMVINDLSVLPT